MGQSSKGGGNKAGVVFITGEKAMAQGGLTPIRRVVTGNDENGKSKVVWDGPAPGTHEAIDGRAAAATSISGSGTRVPPPLSGTKTTATCTYDFPGPPKGGHLRVVQGCRRARRLRCRQRSAYRAAPPDQGRAARPALGPRRHQRLLRRHAQDRDRRLRDPARRRAHAGARRRRSASGSPATS